MKKIFTIVNKVTNMVYILVFSFALLSCGDEALFWNEEKEPEKYSEENVFLDEKDMSWVVSRTDEGKVQFSKETPLNKIPEVGKVLALPIDEQYPVGYYGKVKEITKQDATWEVQLEPATIAEIYPDTVLYYKGPVYLLDSSRAGDDINLDINLNYGLVNISGAYTMVSPEVEYKVETANGKEVGRTFKIISRVKTETEVSFLGDDIDWESKPFASVYLVGGKFSKYLGLGIKADFNGRIVGEVDIDVALTHTMEGQMSAGFSVGDHLVDSIGQITNEFDVVINDWEWSKFQKVKGEVGFGVSLKAYTDVNFLGWKFNTDDNLFLRVAALANFKSDFDYENFNYKDVNNEIETGVKLIVDYKAGFMKEDISGNEIFVGWSDSAEWYMKWSTHLIWPEFRIISAYYNGSTAMAEVWLEKNEALLTPFCDKALVWYDHKTMEMCGARSFNFGKYNTVVIEGLEPEKLYRIYPALRITENTYIRIGDYTLIGKSSLDIPGSDFVLP